jgi:CheY-like chemotaxis protein
MYSKGVFIIDDDKDDRLLFIEAIKEISNSIECTAFTNGIGALDLLNKDNAILPDYIFLDLNMPCFDGKQCLIEIKKNPKINHIPVIIYSTTQRPEDIKETIDLGASYFITKPVLFREICNSISFILEGKWKAN